MQSLNPFTFCNLNHDARQAKGNLRYRTTLHYFTTPRVQKYLTAGVPSLADWVGVKEGEPLSITSSFPLLT